MLSIPYKTHFNNTPINCSLQFNISSQNTIYISYSSNFLFSSVHYTYRYPAALGICDQHKAKNIKHKRTDKAITVPLTAHKQWLRLQSYPAMLTVFLDFFFLPPCVLCVCEKQKKKIAARQTQGKPLCLTLIEIK